jgi:glycosyltransferase involved in cell wall biosynthesis
MRVAVNLLGLPSVRQGGAGFYCRMLVDGLEQSGEVETVILGGEEVAAELSPERGRREVVGLRRGRQPRVRKVLELAVAARDPRRYSDGYDAGSERLFSGCDLVHYPLSFTGPPPHRLPTVMTCMDLQHLELPQAFSLQDRLLRSLRWNRALRRADRIVAPSLHTRTALVERLGIPASRVDVIPLACDDRFFEAAVRSPRVPGNFLFYPASPLPAKNHERLAQAFSRVAGAHPTLRLALSGPVGHDWSPVEASVRAAGIADRVDFLGHLSFDELHSRYASARALVFPSLFEGFGIPLVEAMASGCPVVAGRVASIPEVVGEAAMLFDPRSTTDLADAIERCLALSDGERERMIARARQRAEAFRVERMVHRTLESYQRVKAEAG